MIGQRPIIFAHHRLQLSDAETLHLYVRKSYLLRLSDVETQRTIRIEIPVAFAVFAHATLLKTSPVFQYILNIITVAGSADADPKFHDPHISVAVTEWNRIKDPT